MVKTEKLENNYGMCQKCQQPNMSKNWCQPCFDRSFDNIKSLSGSELIEKFIQQQANDERGTLEWIPYEQFTNIEYLAEGGFGKIYKAEWDEGWNKYSINGVALKVLNNSRDMTADSLKEIAYHNLLNNQKKRCDKSGNVVKFHGISKDYDGNYVMVMDYFEGGTLRQFMDKCILGFSGKIDQLYYIARGLEDIHEKGLVHKDFHMGNILSE